MPSQKAIFQTYFYRINVDRTEKNMQNWQWHFMYILSFLNIVFYFFSFREVLSFKLEKFKF